MRDDLLIGERKDKLPYRISAPQGKAALPVLSLVDGPSSRGPLCGAGSLDLGQSDSKATMDYCTVTPREQKCVAVTSDKCDYTVEPR